ncbi:MAG: HAMP domain-containing sensor histidine kinase [Desulfurivibrionaceae bacterium]
MQKANPDMIGRPLQMRLSIFARLIISYLILSGMLAGVSLFFIYQFSQFNKVIQSIMLNDTAVLEFSNQLSDALLSETRYDRKYVVLQNEQLYLNYLEAKADFEQLLNQATAAAKLADTKKLLREIHAEHLNFSKLVMEEKELIELARPYSFASYAEEKKKVAGAIINRLKTSREVSEDNVLTKVSNLSEFSDKVGRFSITITIISLITCLLVAVVITRSITKPINIIKAKTKEISKGNFQEDLEVNSPPAIKELAVAINAMCRRLQEVDDIKSNFFAHMSHELRTPLASIKEGTNILLDGLGGEISKKQQRILSIITQESNRMITLVNSLLDLSKMEAGMTTYNFTRTNIATLLGESLHALMPLAEAKSISIDNQIDSLPSVNADQDRLMVVFQNIIGNALKFTDTNGKITLAADIKGNFVEIRVQDSGIGISQNDLDKIFLKFRQIIPTKGGKTQGTGLGLATAKQIILAHGGKVWATSREGEGSTFYISLSLAV